MLQIKIQQRDLATGISALLRTSKLSMIDLAGSERASATRNRGERLVEGPSCVARECYRHGRAARLGG